MGILIDSLTFSGITLPALYCSIGGTCQIFKNKENMYTISYTYKISKDKGIDPLLVQTTCAYCGALPTDIWRTIYNDVKVKLDPNFGTAKQSINFTDV